MQDVHSEYINKNITLDICTFLAHNSYFVQFHVYLTIVSYHLRSEKKGGQNCEMLPRNCKFIALFILFLAIMSLSCN